MAIELKDSEVRSIYVSINDKNSGIGNNRIDWDMLLLLKNISSELKESYQNGQEIANNMLERGYGEPIKNGDHLMGFKIKDESLFYKKLFEVLDNDSTLKSYQINKIPASWIKSNNIKMTLGQQKSLEKIIDFEK